MSNLGVSVLLFTLVFALIIFLVILIKKISDASEANNKCNQRIKQILRKIFYNSIIRYFMLNALKLNLTGLVSLTSVSRTGADTALSVIILATMLNIVPITLTVVLHNKHEQLKEAETKERIGTIYIGKNVNRIDHEEQWTPLHFFFRRTLFICVTVFFFSEPSIQIITVLALSAVTIIYMAHDKNKFESQAQRCVEVGSESLFLSSLIILQQFTDLSLTEEQKAALETCFLTAVALLTAFNLLFILRTLILRCKEKSRLKALEAKRQHNIELYKNKWQARTDAMVAAMEH